MLGALGRYTGSRLAEMRGLLQTPRFCFLTWKTERLKGSPHVWGRTL